MSTPKNTLLPAVIESAVKPKPTKREILDALATLHIEGLKKENVERTERRKQLDDEIEAYLLKLFRKSGAGKFKVDSNYHTWNDKYSASLHFSFVHDDIPPALRKLMKERENSENHSIPMLAYARKQIAAKMSGIEPHDKRVSQLLTDAESRKALGEMLTVLAK